MPSFPRKKQKKKRVLFSFHTSILLSEHKHMCPRTHADMPYTLTPCVYICWEWSYTTTSIPGNGPRQTWLPFSLIALPSQTFLTKEGGKKKNERMDTQCTYLTQKYKTTGPDFLGKSCSKTLRSSWSQFKCPLRKRETSGLGLWVLLEFLGTKVYVLQNMRDHR